MLLTLVLAGCLGCATPPREPRTFDFFEPLPLESIWSARIRLWQASHRLESFETEPLPTSTPLAEGYESFSRELRFATAQRVVDWVQLYGGLYFKPDAGGDYWPTLGEVMSSGGDDCDGLELLSFLLLRRMGFAAGELYRAVLFSPHGDVYHMVTLWFREGGKSDPWVLDPSGQVTRRLERLSQLSGWEPIALFDEESLFKARLAP